MSDRESRSRAAFVAVERRDLAVEPVPIQLARELHQLNDLTEQRAAQSARLAVRMPIAISPDSARDAADHRVLYILGFGIAGAIVTNGLVFIYFVLFYASG